VQALRYAFAVVAVAVLLALAYQVFLAGLALFAGGTWQSHADFGYLASLLPVLLIPLAWFARAGRGTVILTVVLLVLAQVQTFLPLAADSAAWVAALHPVNALLVFGAAAMVAQRAVALARLAASAERRG
jgi:hypothetical protein